jgi:hypothetical protein
MRSVLHGEEEDAASPAKVVDEEVEPRASSLVESLRAFGYSPEAALADLIDNSITAEASNVWLEFLWNGSESHVVILDDGRGMTEAELREAMRPGTMSPLDLCDSENTSELDVGLGLGVWRRAGATR